MTGESPIVDVQSARHAADHRQGRPRGDSLVAERRRHPVDHSRDDREWGFRRHQRHRCRAAPPPSTADARTTRGSMPTASTWAGPAAAAAAADAAGGRGAGSGDDDLGRACRSRDERRDLQRRPARGVEPLHRAVQLRGSNGALQGSNYTQALQNAGLRAPFELINVYDVSAMYGGRIKRDKLWFYGVYRQVGGERTVPGMFYNKNAGNPNSWLVDFDRSKQAFNNSLERQATIRLTWQATPRNKFNAPLVRTVQRRQLRSGGRHRDDDAGSVEPRACTSRPANPTPPGSRRSPAACWPRPAGACIRRATASACATTVRTTRR